MSERRFRIAFSFSGDKRDFVAEIAGILAGRFGADRVLYDKYHQAEFARSDLAFHLPALYHDESDLIVAVLSNDYEKKEWCGLEWNAIYGLIMERKYDKVMLCRFDRVEVKGLFGLAGFIDLDDKAHAEVATLITERLALNEGHPRDYSTRDTPPGPDWPAVAPPLDWPVADHSEAQRSFAQLITRAVPFRLLLIHGVSETGKSHLTKQFLRNALKMPDLTCGRFDFKGSSDMDAELRAFAERLDVPTPTPGTGVSRQLAQIFASVKKAARPTLLIFDTFELAGEAERWVKDNLLLDVIRAPWLRVIIVGQRVPTLHGEPWADVSSQPIELRLPTPEEWFTYGKPYKTAPGFTLELVRNVYDIVNGKSSILAQICGPEA
jgi:TIR domain-containing protein